MPPVSQTGTSPRSARVPARRGPPAEARAGGSSARRGAARGDVALAADRSPGSSMRWPSASQKEADAVPVELQLQEAAAPLAGLQAALQACLDLGGHEELPEDLGIVRGLGRRAPGPASAPPSRSAPARFRPAPRRGSPAWRRHLRRRKGGR